MNSPDLFAWADERERTARARGPAQVAALPIPGALVRKLALRFAPYDDRRAQFFLQRELEAIVRRRLKAGVPEAIVVQQCSDLEVAIWTEILRLDATDGDAA